MSLSKKEVDAVAHLARLDISEEMAEKMAGQLNQILDLIAKLNELDTSGVEPLSHPGALASVWRDDVPAASLPRESALRNAPDATDGFFRVPRVIE